MNYADNLLECININNKRDEERPCFVVREMNNHPPPVKTKVIINDLQVT